MTFRVAILVSGTGSNMVSLIKAMADPDFGAEPVLVLSSNADAGALERARRLSVPTAIVDHRDHRGDRISFDREINARLVDARANVVCLAGFMHILGANLVETWRGRILNIHPSLLPDYKGLDTHRRAIADGQAKAGCTVHLVTAELDAGPIVAQSEVPILPADTADSLAKRVLEAEHRLYPTALKAHLASLNTEPVLPNEWQPCTNA